MMTTKLFLSQILPEANLKGSLSVFKRNVYMYDECQDSLLYGIKHTAANIIKCCFFFTVFLTDLFSMTK